jgi:hypothetical protein
VGRNFMEIALSRVSTFASRALVLVTIHRLDTEELRRLSQFLFDPQ